METEYLRTCTLTFFWELHLILGGKSDDEKREDLFFGIYRYFQWKRNHKTAPPLFLFKFLNTPLLLEHLHLISCFFMFLAFVFSFTYANSIAAVGLGTAPCFILNWSLAQLLIARFWSGRSGFDSWTGQIGTVSPTARHRCDVSSELCCPRAKPRRWAPPFDTRFGVTPRV